jgi:hypothetical protein
MEMALRLQDGYTRLIRLQKEVIQNLSVPDLEDFILVR